MLAKDIKMRGSFRRKGNLTVYRRMWFRLNEYLQQETLTCGSWTYIGAVIFGKYPSDQIQLIPQDEEVTEIK